MKKLLLSAFVAFAMLASTKTLAQQGFGTNTPNKSAAVDIVSSQRGLLVPRLDLSSTTVAMPVDAPAHGLLVYNKATATGTNGVEPGFYYWERNDTTDETAWQGKWVRIISTNSDKNTVVAAGENIKVNGQTSGLTTTYTVSVDGGTNNGQVLVSIPNTDPLTSATEPFVSEWVDPDDFIKGVNGINVTTDALGNTNVSIGGALTKPGITEITTNSATNSLAITGLDILDASSFDPTSQNIVVMGSDGILKEVSPKTLIEDTIDAGTLTAKSVKSSGMITLNGTVADATNTVLKEITLGIADKSITSDKLSSANIGGVAGNAPDGTIATADGNGNVAFESPSTAIGKALTTDNIIGVGADATAASGVTANLLNGAVLTPTYLKIKDDAITAAQIAENAVGASELADNSVASANVIDGSIANADLGEKSVSANKMTSTVTNAAGVVTSTAPINTVPTADGAGGVTYQTVAAAAGKTLTTDGKITVLGGTTATTMDQAVLVATTIGIAPESITSADIKDGTITTTDIKAPNSSTDNNLDGDENMVMVTDTNGDVKWISQSALANKDNYTFTAPLSKSAGTPNTTTGGTDYTVSIATASATTLGVVKQSAATGEEITIGTDGSLSINEANVTVGSVTGSDVTGKLNDLTVTGIQGTAVSSATPSAANNMLVYNSTSNQWEPSTVAAAAGKSLTGAGITITPGANATPGTATSLAAAVLADVTLGIANDAITNDKLADNAVRTENIENGAVGNVDLAAGSVSADKMTSFTGANGTTTPAADGMVPVADGAGGVTYETVASAVGKELSTDGVIVIGANASATATSAPASILADVKLNIGTDKITATHIAPDAVGASELADNSVASANIINGTIKAEDMLAPGSTTDNNLNGTVNQVMVTNASGAVTWVNQTDLPSNTKIDNGVNTTVTGNGSTASPFAINVNTANATTTGAVKQATTGTEEVTIATDGTLSINESNVNLSGDVTGPLNNTNVGAIQGVAVATTAPLADQVMTYNGVTSQWTPATPTSLVKVDNGISKATDGDIILGGTLNETATTIITGGAANTLAVQGLIVPTAATTEVMYAEGSTGVLRKAVRSVYQAVSTSQNVSAITGYNDFVQEINITATIGSTDINISLPTASTTNKGQVVNVKIGNTTEPANYVNIISGATTLTYGALPYQGWIVKSNGSAWEIVGRN